MVIILIALGVPIGACLLLFREKQRQPVVEESLKHRVAEVFNIPPDEAEYAINDVRMGSSYGFLVDAFKPRYFMWESVDMLSSKVRGQHL